MVVELSVRKYRMSLFARYSLWEECTMKLTNALRFDVHCLLKPIIIIYVFHNRTKSTDKELEYNTIKLKLRTKINIHNLGLLFA